ncbi:HIRAN domain-containing protein [Methylotuvimicrobium sp. KM1]|uniref:HIRAN domain-containing protein n=1 Tax=Methylotuvimicrobium sp. KM1 TaxID=3377707 RepID=UPI00384CF658
MEVEGFRYQRPIALKDISVGMNVDLVAEPENEHDHQAVRIEAMGNKIGYVNKVQSPAFIRWLQDDNTITAVIERINGTEERPLIYIYGRIGAKDISQIVA